MDFIIAISLITLTVLEQLLPRNKQAFFRKGFVEDLFYMIMVLYFLEYANFYVMVGMDFIGDNALLRPGNWPPIVEFTVCFLVYDFTRYWLHRLEHFPDRLWHIHKVHHSALELSSISGFRGGYWEDLFMTVLSIPVVALIGFNREYIWIAETIFAIHGFFLHSNINVRFPKILNVICCPYFHASHHIREKKLNHSNFGATFTFWDKIFGTYYLPDNLKFNDLGLISEKEHNTIYSLNYIYRYFYFPFWKK